MHHSTPIRPHYLIYALAVIPTLTMLTTFILCTLYPPTQEYASRTVPFISMTIDYPLTSCIGTLGFGITALLGWTAIMLRWCQQHGMLLEVQKNNIGLRHLFAFSHLAVLCGNLCMLGLMGLISFQHHNQEITHISFSFLFFIAALFYEAFSTAVDRSLDTYLCLALGKVYVLRVAIVVFQCLLLPVFLTAQWFGSDADLSASAVAEILSTALIFVYVISFVCEMRRYEWEVGVLRQHDDLTPLVQNFS